MQNFKLDSINLGYYFRYGDDGIFKAKVNVENVLQNDRFIDKFFSYAHIFGESTYEAGVEDNNIHTSLAIRYFNDDDGVGFKT